MDYANSATKKTTPNSVNLDVMLIADAVLLMNKKDGEYVDRGSLIMNPDIKMIKESGFTYGNSVCAWLI